MLAIAVFTALGLAGLFIAAGSREGSLHMAGVALFLASGITVFLSLKILCVRSRKPDWAGDDITFLASRGDINAEFGLEGKQMGFVVMTLDGFVAFSCLVDASGRSLDYAEQWLAETLVKG